MGILVSSFTILTYMQAYPPTDAVIDMLTAGVATIGVAVGWPFAAIFISPYLQFGLLQSIAGPGVPALALAYLTMRWHTLPGTPSASGASS